jgi:alpha-amylase
MPFRPEGGDRMQIDPQSYLNKIANPFPGGVVPEGFDPFRTDAMPGLPAESVEISRTAPETATGKAKRKSRKKTSHLKEKTADRSETSAEQKPALQGSAPKGSAAANPYTAMLADNANFPNLDELLSQSPVNLTDMPAVMTSLPKVDGESVIARTTYKKTGMNDQYILNDGFDQSRDITGVQASEGKPTEPYRFTVELNKLQSGAEAGNLDLYLLISVGQNGAVNLPDGIPGSTEKPWNVAIGAYDGKNFKIYDEKGAVDGKMLKELTFDSGKSAVSFALDKSILRDKGWKDGEPLQLQPFTTKDFTKKVIDTIDEPSQKPWNREGKLSGTVDTGAPSAAPAEQVKEGKAHALPSAPPSAPTPSETKKDWRDESIYFVLTDRFDDADPTNNQGVDKTNLKRYHGGDLQGVINKLDYIKDLGMTSVWVTPTMLNQKEFFDSDGYHGYWPIDFFQTDPHVGSMDKFKELISKAHEKGLKVILDIPLNHTAWAHPFVKDPQKYDWFHHIGDIKDWDDPYQAENGSLFGLPDLAQEKPEVEKYLIDAAKFWIDTGIDGFRLDAVKNVPLSFWSKFDREVHKYAGEKFFLVGEYFDGNPAKLAKIQREDMTSLFDYPLYFNMKDVFINDGSMRNLAGAVAAGNNEYPHPEMMSCFLDNHDTPRFLTLVKGNKDKYKMALAFQMTLNRIPQVYYGDEVGMEGSCDIMGDLSNRKDMEWNKDPEILKYFKQLTSLRNNNPALSHGEMKEMWQDDKIYAYSRMVPDQEAIVVLNNGHDGQERDIPLRAESHLKNGTVLKDMLTGETVKVENGKIHARLNGKMARIFLPA